MEEPPDGDVLLRGDAEDFPERCGKLRAGHAQQCAELRNLDIPLQLQIDVIDHLHEFGKREDGIRQMSGYFFQERNQKLRDGVFNHDGIGKGVACFHGPVDVFEFLPEDSGVLKRS